MINSAFSFWTNSKMIKSAWRKAGIIFCNVNPRLGDYGQSSMINKVTSIELHGRWNSAGCFDDVQAQSMKPSQGSAICILMPSFGEC